MSLTRFVNRLITNVSKGEPVSEEEIATITRRVNAGDDTKPSFEALDEYEHMHEPGQDTMKELNKIRSALMKKGGRRRKTRRRRRITRRKI